MNVIRHDCRYVELHRSEVIVATGIEDNIACRRWQDPSRFRVEGNEMRSGVALEMRQDAGHAKMVALECMLPRAKAPAASQFSIPN